MTDITSELNQDFKNHSVGETNEGDPRAWLKEIVEARWFEFAIIGLILVNAILLGLETSETVMASWGGLLERLDLLILAVFVAELIAKIYVYRRKFFTDPWCIFDFLVVTVSLIPATGHLTVLRALRVLRVLRLISAIPSMRRVVAGLLHAIPSMGSVIALLLLILYVAAVMATQMFGVEFPQLFGSLSASTFTLVQIMTMEGWADLSGPVMDKFPYAWIFFLVYMLVTSFAVLNLFIGIIVDAMQHEAIEPLHEREDEEMELSQQMLSEIRELRAEISELKAQSK